MSTVCRNCQNRVQRLQGGGNNTPPPSGSRRGNPGALRPRRALAQIIHTRRTAGNPGLERRRPWPCESKPEAKTAAFFNLASSRKPHFSTRCNWLEARKGTALRFFSSVPR